MSIARMPTDLKDDYNRFRDYMKHEDDLLNHRSTWHLLIQGFLFGTLGVLGEWQFPREAGDFFHVNRLNLAILLSGVGFSIAVLAFLAVWGANLAMKVLCDKWKNLGENYNPEDLKYYPGIAGGGSRWAEQLGKLAALAIPPVIAAAWVVVFLFVIWGKADSTDSKADATGAVASICDQRFPTQSTTPPRRELLAEIACAEGAADDLTEQLAQRFHMQVAIADLKPGVHKGSKGGYVKGQSRSKH